MKIGLLKEEKIPLDRRVVFTPKQCSIINNTYPNISLVVESSEVRCFSDQDYIDAGIEVVYDISDCDVLLGVKEVPLESLLPDKTYFYFSHTIKEQPYNRELLVRMIKMNIRMIDYEVLKNEKGERLLGFGRYAGVVGAYNGFLTYGLKTDRYRLKPAYQCRDRIEMEKELDQLILHKEKIIVTGNGRVGKGAMEIMKKSGIKEVSVNEFLNEKFSEPIFLHLKTMDYYDRIDGCKSDKYDFYNNPELYKSSFLRFARKADIFIAGHYYSSGSPFLFTREDAKLNGFNLKVVADISCDIDGPVASTIRPSSIEEPIYGYCPRTEQEVSFKENDAIAVMAVSNLPCELPRDASEDFGNEMLDKIFPYLMDGDSAQVLSNATICNEGNLSLNFEYLRDYVNGR